MDEVFSSQPDLTDQLISHPDVEYFTDGSSFVQDSTRFAGYAEVILNAVTEAHLLLVRTSAQKAELIVLMQVLQLAAGMWANIYTDSKYTFITSHVHGTLDKERGLINLTRKNVKYGQGILELLEAVWTPKRVAVMHCQGH
jgi:ribonuclease HI